MTLQQKSLVWLLVLVCIVTVLVLLKGILLPFVIGMVVAYLLDPVCDWLEGRNFSRVWASVTVSIVFFVLIALTFAFLTPLIINQVAGFIENIPVYISALEMKLTPLVVHMISYLDVDSTNDIKKFFGQHIGDAAAIAGRVIFRLLSGLETVLNVISIIAITPIVAFYLLRDWDRIIVLLSGYLPPAHRVTIKEQVCLIDSTLSGFLRGQIMVCLLLGVFYAVGLMIIGLDFGLIIGLGTGMVSFVPYFGMLAGVLVGLGLAIAQFDSMGPILAVGLLFASGQFLEGNFVTPKLVGDRVGLHAVWIIFALMAGGALFGFLGILLAVPMAAVIGVLVRFTLDRYLQSGLFTDHKTINSKSDKP